MEENPLNQGAGDTGSTPPPLPPSAESEQPVLSSTNAVPPAGDGPYTFTADSGQASAGGDFSRTMSPPAGTRFTAGEVFSRTWSIMMKNAGLYLGLALIPTVPSFIGDILPESLVGSLMSILSSCLGLILQAAIAYAVYRTMSGDKTTAGKAFSKGMKRFLPVLGASILLGIMVGVGYILLVVPGLILTCIFIVTIPACAVEHTGAIDSLRRSAILTKGCRWTIFILLVALYAIIAIISLVLVTVLVSVTESDILLSLLINAIILIPTAFQSVMTAVIYYTLREVKEGVSVESLANVFD
ncbi:MAG: hypothetical protein LIQ31_05205 [Planctomycetes bacterium]|nr:hypothetical protein [Planctomycetota bacterium]